MVFIGTARHAISQRESSGARGGAICGLNDQDAVTCGGFAEATAVNRGDAGAAARRVASAGNAQHAGHRGPWRTADLGLEDAAVANVVALDGERADVVRRARRDGAGIGDEAGDGTDAVQRRPRFDGRGGRDVAEQDERALRDLGGAGVGLRRHEGERAVACLFHVARAADDPGVEAFTLLYEAHQPVVGDAIRQAQCVTLQRCAAAHRGCTGVAGIIALENERACADSR